MMSASPRAHRHGSGGPLRPREVSGLRSARTGHALQDWSSETSGAAAGAPAVAVDHRRVEAVRRRRHRIQPGEHSQAGRGRTTPYPWRARRSPGRLWLGDYRMGRSIRSASPMAGRRAGLTRCRRLAAATRSERDAPIRRSTLEVGRRPPHHRFRERVAHDRPSDRRHRACALGWILTKATLTHRGYRMFGCSRRCARPAAGPCAAYRSAPEGGRTRVGSTLPYGRTSGRRRWRARACQP